MKKSIIAMLAVLSMTAALAPASFADSTGDAINNQASLNWSDITTAIPAGSEASVIIVKAPVGDTTAGIGTIPATINDEDILYADQATKAATNTEFQNMKPKEYLEAGQKYYILVGDDNSGTRQASCFIVPAISVTPGGGSTSSGGGGSIGGSAGGGNAGSGGVKKYSFVTSAAIDWDTHNHDDIKFRLKHDGITKYYNFPSGYRGEVVFDIVVLTDELGTYYYCIVNTSTGTDQLLIDEQSVEVTAN